MPEIVCFLIFIIWSWSWYVIAIIAINIKYEIRIRLPHIILDLFMNCIKSVIIVLGAMVVFVYVDAYHKGFLQFVNDYYISGAIIYLSLAWSARRTARKRLERYRDHQLTHESYGKPSIQ